MNNFELCEIFEQADSVGIKSRAIIYNEKTNQILLAKYAGMYLLPGGKIDKNEDPLDAVSREVKEEAGLIFEKNDFRLFSILLYGQRNYESKDGQKVTKALNDLVFIVPYNKLVNKVNIKLSKNEKKDDFSLSWVDLDTSIKLIEENNSSNPRISLYKEPLCYVIKKFMNEGHKSEYDYFYITKNNQDSSKFYKNVELTSNNDFSFGITLNNKVESEALICLDKLGFYKVKEVKVNGDYDFNDLIKCFVDGKKFD